MPIQQALRTAIAQAFRFLRKAPILDSALLGVEDGARTAIFVLRVAQRRKLKNALSLSRSPRDVLSIATRAFFANQNWPEVLGLIERLKAEEPRIVCEIGVAGGGTNFLLTHALPKVELMLGVDLYVKGRMRLRYFAGPGQRLLYFNGASQSPAMVARIGDALAGRKLDVLFIDGDHSYAGVRGDFLSYRKFVREGGTIVFHDICPDSMTRHGRPSCLFAGDVPVFWKKIRQSYPYEEFVQNEGQDAYGIGAIRYSSTTPIPTDL